MPLPVLCQILSTAEKCPGRCGSKKGGRYPCYGAAYFLALSAERDDYRGFRIEFIIYCLCDQILLEARIEWLKLLTFLINAYNSIYSLVSFLYVNMYYIVFYLLCRHVLSLPIYTFHVTCC